METERIVLIGCVGKKRPSPSGAVWFSILQLYDSALWRARLQFARDSGCIFGVLSAELGVVPQWGQGRMYERKIQDRPPQWAEHVRLGVENIRNRFGPHTVLELEVHAGAPYVKALAAVLPDRCQITHPVQGLQIGELLRWYKLRREANS